MEAKGLKTSEEHFVRFSAKMKPLASKSPLHKYSNACTTRIVLFSWQVTLSYPAINNFEEFGIQPFCERIYVSFSK